MNNCRIYQDDVFLFFIDDKETVISYYGKDILDESGIELPQNLLERVKNWEKETELLQSVLAEYFRKQEKL